MRNCVLALVATMLSLSGCSRFERAATWVDQLAFAHLGGTLFTDPSRLSLKEIHLGDGTFTGREVIIEGRVAEVSQHGTYFVLTDDSARMLVVLTDLAGAAPVWATDTKPRAVRVLGTLESGQKGLPYVKAQAIDVVKDPASA